MAKQRLHKLLAAAGVGSLRQMEDYIRTGRVRVNGQLATPGVQVEPRDDKVSVDGRPIRLGTRRSLPQVLLYHKAEGEIVSRADPEGRPSVFDRLPRLRPGRWVSVGRLDVATSGLLLFTDSGELAHRLMHPSYGMLRTYAVRVRGEISEADQRQLITGVELEDGPARVERIEAAGGTGVNHWYHLNLAEGRNREVRRIVAAIGLEVSRLIRLGFGPVRLPPRLRTGHVMRMPEPEVLELMKAVGLEGGNADRPRTPLRRRTGRPASFKGRSRPASARSHTGAAAGLRRRSGRR